MNAFGGAKMETGKPANAPAQGQGDDQARDSVEETIDNKLRKLGHRIKNTSTVRFVASKRVRFNYGLANLTVVILSLWAIFFAYFLASGLKNLPSINLPVIEAAGIILPVFIVVFSLVEGGENLVRAYLMELNARQLRELGDDLFAATANLDHDAQKKVASFETFSKRYNDILERSPINHDDVDHWSRYFARRRKDVPEFSWRWWYYLLVVLFVWSRRQGVRVLYLVLWLLPLVAFLVPPSIGHAPLGEPALNSSLADPAPAH
jgi:hypothetical protein